MKKSLAILAAITLSVTAANAQGLLGSLLGGSSSSKEQNTYTGTQNGLFDLLKGSSTQSVAESLLGLVTGTTTTCVDLSGTWTYNGVAANVSSENLFGSIAAKAATKTVETKIDEYFSKVGIKPGIATLTFGKDYSFVMNVGAVPIKGTWTQEADKVTIKLGKAFTFLKLEGIVKSEAGGCEILFNADKFLAFAAKAVEVVGSISGNGLTSTLSSVINNCQGLDAGFHLVR